MKMPAEKEADDQEIAGDGGKRPEERGLDVLLWMIAATVVILSFFAFTEIFRQAAV
jgi:hypothetical protein